MSTVFYIIILATTLIAFFSDKRSAISDKVSLVTILIYVFFTAYVDGTQANTTGTLGIVINLVTVLLVMLMSHSKAGNLWEKHGFSLVALGIFLFALVQNIRFLM